MKRQIIIEIENNNITVVKCEIETKHELMLIVKELVPFTKNLPSSKELPN